MSNFKTLLLATAVSVAGFAGAADAATYVSQSTAYSSAAPGVVVTTAPATRIVGGRTVAAESMIAVGTRKVGHIAGRPYPIENAHVENTTYRATPHGVVGHTEVTTAGGPIHSTEGGDYYTETDGSFYADPAWNVNVYTTGSFND
ncbi:MAG TPA: hypothetical protein VIN59_08105 [Alphaproteobacteria bacterium]